MAFYETPAFFVLLTIAAIPAIVEGCMGKQIKRYGFAVSLVFLLLLFSRNLQGLACMVGFLVWSLALIYYVFHLFAVKSTSVQKEPRAGKSPSEGKSASEQGVLSEDGVSRTHNTPHTVAKYRICLALPILLLVIYKVSAVFDANLLGFLGISYITFKVVQVLLETRDGLIEKVPVFDCLYFLVFFAPFISRPIMRSREFMQDLEHPLESLEYRKLSLRGPAFIIIGALCRFLLVALASWAMWFLPSWFAGSAVLAELSQAWG